LVSREDRIFQGPTAGELTASIAHEINQPLGAILTNAEPRFDEGFRFLFG
jgi:signal transduction histidine kinase